MLSVSTPPYTRQHCLHEVSLSVLQESGHIEKHQTEMKRKLEMETQLLGCCSPSKI